VCSIFVLCASTHKSFERELTLSEWMEYYSEDPEMFRKIGSHVIHMTLLNQNVTGNVSIDDGSTSTSINLTRQSSGMDLLSLLANKAVRTTGQACQSSYCQEELRDGIASSNNGTASGPMRQRRSFWNEAGLRTIPKPSFLPVDVHGHVVYLDIMSYCLVMYFTIELIARIVFSPHTCRLRFFTQFLNIVDIVALTSEYVTLLMKYWHPKLKFTDMSPADAVQAIQIARVFRLFRLLEHSVGFRVLVYSIKASFKSVMMMVCVLLSGALIFSTLVYFCDKQQFASIPDAFWWSVITMTTVGYGDMYPRNVYGKIVGCACAVSGVIVLALMIAIVVRNYMLLLGYARASQINTNGCKSRNKQWTVDAHVTYDGEHSPNHST
jgi:hypothetical protein